MTKTENSVSKDWPAKATVEHGIKICECQYRRK